MIQRELLSISQRAPTPLPHEPLIAMTRRQLDAYTKEITAQSRCMAHAQLHQRLSETHGVIMFQSIIIGILAFAIIYLVC